MKIRTKYLILFASILILTACDGKKNQEKARALFEEGVRLREERHSEEAAECFLQGLELLNNDVKTHGRESLQLVADINDNLGALYLKHGLFDGAFDAHNEALRCFKILNDSTGMMNAYRNCGRAVRSQEQYTLAKQYYDSAFCIATSLNDNAMLSDLYLEMGRDYYMEIGDFAKGIECVNKALDGELSNDDIDIAHMTLGILYYYSNNFDEAKKHLKEALRSERPGVKMSVYQTLYAVAYYEGDYKSAVYYQQLFSDNMLESEHQHSSETMQRLKSEYELKAQKNALESQHHNHSLKLYLIIALSVIAFLIILLIIRKKINENKIKALEKELEIRNKIMLSNKVFVTAKNLGEHLTSETMDFTLDDNDWDDFISLTDMIFNDFSKRLLATYPKLGKWDVRICCLCKNGFSNQVISILLDTQTDSFYKRKTRIRQQKMGIPNDERTFEEIINAI
ncbi:MAG: tetratricopeptide repeat protein [Bacteroidales bacterium]|nr:tetratricopeptide repeat protein [Bacteroidales bacterium]MBQ3845883.1 tetratricopeptide repeat protein [Bacteroidales bacterium]